MFCKQCGKHLEPGLPRCPHCGRVPDALSGGTGFWDLTQAPAAPVQTPPVQTTTVQAAPVQPVSVQTPVQPQTAVPTPTPQPVRIVPPAAPTPPPLAEEPEETPARHFPLISVVILALAVVLLMALVFQSIRVGRLEHRLDEVQAALSAAESVRESQPEASAVPEAPAPSMAPTPEVSQTEIQAEASPEAEVPATPSPEPPEETAQPVTPSPTPVSAVTEPPAVTAQLSRDWETITLKVDNGDLEVETYEWIVIYDSALETTEDCLQLLDRAMVAENETLRAELLTQVDTYDGSSGRKTQRIPVEEFYGDAKSYTKRVFCKMVLEDGSVLCSEIVSPMFLATRDYVSADYSGDLLTAGNFALPEDMVEEGITCRFLAVDPGTWVETLGEAQVYAPELTLEAAPEAGLRYYLILEKEDARILLAGPWEMDAALGNVVP